MGFLFEKLDVYRKSVDFAGKISDLTRDFQRGNYYLADQLNKASRSSVSRSWRFVREEILLTTLKMKRLKKTLKIYPECCPV